MVVMPSRSRYAIASVRKVFQSCGETTSRAVSHAWMFVRWCVCGGEVAWRCMEMCGERLLKNLRT
eukprot:1719326-Rhodomonas_salina.1